MKQLTILVTILVTMFVFTFQCHAQILVTSESPTDCDRLAAAPFDEGRITVGVHFLTINATEAVQACRKAFIEDPAKPRLAYQLGRTLFRAKQYKEAVQYFKIAAKKGYAAAMNGVGVAYANGVGAPRNISIALKWYTKAAQKGHARAMSSLAMHYNTGRGIPKDHSLAMLWYKRSAEKGLAAAMLEVGILYYNGRGTERNYTQAMEWFKKAASRGNAAAMGQIGFMHDFGNGVIQDHAKAMKWYRKAADKGDKSSFNNIGSLYFNGHGVTQDFKEAMKWYQKAAARGEVNAMSNIGLINHKGIGVSQNTLKAMEWCLLYQAKMGKLPEWATDIYANNNSSPLPRTRYSWRGPERRTRIQHDGKGRHVLLYSFDDLTKRMTNKQISGLSRQYSKIERAAGLARAAKQKRQMGKGDNKVALLMLNGDELPFRFFDVDIDDKRYSVALGGKSEIDMIWNGALRRVQWFNDVLGAYEVSGGRIVIRFFHRIGARNKKFFDDNGELKSINLLPELFAKGETAGYLHIFPLPSQPSPRPLTFASVGKLAAALEHSKKRVSPLVAKARKAGGQVADTVKRKIGEAGSAIERKVDEVAERAIDAAGRRAEKATDGILDRMLPSWWR